MTPLLFHRVPTFYRPKFYRHLNHLVINGFYARALDADDHAFLEQVRTRGIANGDVPSTSTDLLEERDFWKFPYAVEPGVARKAGPVPMHTVETPEQKVARLARSRAWRTRRMISQQERAIAAAEMEREQREWERANEKRKLRELISDAEWKAAAPRRKLKHGKTVKRHHVPQWKLDERGELNEADERRRAKAARQRLEIEQAKRLDEEREAVQQAAMLEQQRHRTENEAAYRERLAMLEQERRKKIIMQARQTVARLERQQREWGVVVARTVYSPVALKLAIANLIRANAPRPTSFGDLLRWTGCGDEALLTACLTEMARDGQLRAAKTEAA